MNIDKGNVITLENNKKYLILDNFTYNNEQYLYISSLDIRHICFVRVVNNGDNLDIKIVKDKNMIKEFAQNFILNYSNQKPSIEEFLKLIVESNHPNKLEYLLGLIAYSIGDQATTKIVDFLKNNNK